MCLTELTVKIQFNPISKKKLCLFIGFIYSIV